ncbi:MAG: FAD:protein FMN transferase [Phycisphaerales bacterium]|nr:FAD:protein FMN transferase [Phycisphaerales bacterium]
MGITRLIGLFGLLFGLVGCAAAPPLERFEYVKMIMGVEARITLHAPDGATAMAAATDAFRRMDDLDAVLSDYRPDSEIRRIQVEAAAGPVAVSDDLADALGRALDLARRTDGAFDPTVGPVVALWREARRTGRLPPDEARIAALARTGWHAVHLDRSRRPATLRIDGPDMAIDFGGIGKGYAADTALDVLRSRGLGACVVDLGGDLAIGDPPPGRGTWRVAVRAGSGAAAQVDIARAGVATSGDLEQFVEVGGVRYSHIVDPATGLGLTNRVAVTVVAPDATTADALASAASVRGAAGAPALVAAFPGARLRIEQAGPDGVTVFEFPPAARRR